MAESTNIHAELHPRHLLDTRMRRERQGIAERYEPSARELFAARALIAEGKAHVSPSAHRIARMQRAVKRGIDELRELQAWAAAMTNTAQRVLGRAA